MNWGEYIHFTSGAAGADLQHARPPAPSAGPADRTDQLERARQQFPGVTY